MPCRPQAQDGRRRSQLARPTHAHKHPPSSPLTRCGDQTRALPDSLNPVATTPPRRPIECPQQHEDAICLPLTAPPTLHRPSTTIEHRERAGMVLTSLADLMAVRCPLVHDATSYSHHTVTTSNLDTLQHGGHIVAIAANTPPPRRGRPLPESVRGQVHQRQHASEELGRLSPQSTSSPSSGTSALGCMLKRVRKAHLC